MTDLKLDSQVVLSVTELNQLTRKVLEQLPLLWIEGEISGLLQAPSGHSYFNLKDNSAQIRCVLFRQKALLLKLRLQNGDKVKVRALVGLYEPQGNLQINVENIIPAGSGDIHEAFQKLRLQLDAEGLFAQTRKRPLPRLPSSIAVVTSLQAQALGDILATLRRRAPKIAVTIFPTLVQGKTAPQSIVNALEDAQNYSAQLKLDLIILCRGGGSLEDLQAFNHESVARSMFRSQIPIVTGIGHESDFSIADFVADLRAATPTAAAEIVSEGWLQASSTIPVLAEKLHTVVQASLLNRHQILDQAFRQLNAPIQAIATLRSRLGFIFLQLSCSIQSMLRSNRITLDRFQHKLNGQKPNIVALIKTLEQLTFALERAYRTSHYAHTSRFQLLATKLQALSPMATLERGYSITQDAQGNIIRNASTLKTGEALALQFFKGGAKAVVSQVKVD